MGKSIMGFIKGMGVGLVVGCMAGVAANQYMSTGNRGVKKTVNKALDNIRSLVEELGDMIE